MNKRYLLICCILLLSFYSINAQEIILNENNPNESIEIKANNQDTSSMIILANKYSEMHRLPNGYNFLIDYKKAIYWYEKAANFGNTYAMNKLGEIYCREYMIINDSQSELMNPDYTNAFNWYKKAASLGNSNSMYGLGYLYYNGQGTLKDDEMGKYWVDKSANLGNVNAMNYLGTIYEGKDDNLSVIWYQKASDLGDSYAMNNLANVYNKDGELQDIEKSWYWFKKSFFLGNEIAVIGLGDLCASGNGNIQDCKQVKIVLEKLANDGNTYAMTNLARMYYKGEGVLKDDNKSFYWFNKAANNNNGFAQFCLAQFYLMGISVEKSKQKSAYWCKKSYENDYSEAIQFWKDNELWKYKK